jgi:UDP-N-acetylmuramate--alanine ligase
VVVDLSEPRSIYVTSAFMPGRLPLIQVLLERGHRVTVDQSDLRHPSVERLIAFGLRATHQQVPSDVEIIMWKGLPNHQTPAWITESTALQIGRAPLIAGLLPQHDQSVGVTGTAGKTTTTSMIDAVKGGANGLTTSLVGAPRNIDRPMSGADARTLVVEAHEDDRVANIGFDVLVFTNCFTDHSATFGGQQQLEAVFADALYRTRDLRLVDAGDERAMRIARSTGKPFVTYGVSQAADWRVENIRTHAFSSTFDVRVPGLMHTIRDCEVPLPGRHMIRNALAALAVADHFGVDLDIAKSRLRDFALPSQRFQQLGSHFGAQIIADAANLPEELAASIAGLEGGNNERRWGRSIVVIATGNPSVNAQWAQRLDAFADVLQRADSVVITDSWARDGASEVSSNLSALLRDHPRAALVRYDQLADHLASEVRAGDVAMLCGSALGDAYGPILDGLARAERAFGNGAEAPESPRL